jgi:HEAT repeat protein
MSLSHLHSAYLILATLAAGGALAGLLYAVGFIGWVLDLFGRFVKWGVTAGFRVWEATLSWADWRVAAVVAAGIFGLGLAAKAGGASVVEILAALLLLGIGVVTCLAFMYLSFERYEVARGHKAVHNPLKGQELAGELARYGDRVGVMLLVVAAVGTVLGFAQLNHALYGSVGEGWYRLDRPDEQAVFLDFLAYALVHLLRIVDVFDLAQTRAYLSVALVKPAHWPATALLLGFKSFFTLVLLQQVFASVRQGKLLAETVTDFWSPHAPIHERARSALPQFGPTALQPILQSLRSLDPLTKEQRDQLPQVFATMGPTAVPTLLYYAGDPHAPTRGVVARALGLMRVPEAVGRLIELTTDESEEVRAAAAEALGLIAEAATRGRDKVPNGPPVRRGRWRGRLGWLGAAPRVGLFKALAVARWWSRGRAAAADLVLGRGELVTACVAALRKTLADGSAIVRAEAVVALGRIGAPAAPAGPELVAVLSGDADEARKRAAVAVGLVRAEATLAVPSLTAALHDPTPEVRAAAAAALGEYGEAAAEAVPVLVALLQDREEEVRSAAAAAVNKIGVLCDESTRVLVEGLASEDTVTRARTAEALGVIGEAAEVAAPALVEALEDDNDRVRATAVEALGKMGEAVADLAVPKLVRLLRDEDSWVRALAAEAIGQMGEAAEDAAPALLRSLRHPNPLVRANAAEALGRLKAEDTRAALEAACGDDDPGVRAKAVGALAGIGPPTPDSTKVVLGCLTDPDPQVRAAAIDAVGGWPRVTVDPGVFNGLIDDGNDEVAARAIRLAPSLSAADAVLPALRARLAGTTPNPLVQVAAAVALGRLGPAAVAAAPELGAAARGGDAELREAAMRALALIQPPDAAEVFAAGLRDAEPRVRKVASAGLMKVADLPEEAIPAVAESLRDPDEQVRANAAHLLARLDEVPPAAVPDLIENTTAPGDGLRLNAAAALQRVDDPAARDALRRLLADPNPRVRLVAAGAVAADDPTDPAVRAAVVESLRDPNPKVQEGAADLARSLGLEPSNFEPLPEAGGESGEDVPQPAAAGVSPLGRSPTAIP